jgi:hypothetical protein
LLEALGTPRVGRGGGDWACSGTTGSEEGAGLDKRDMSLEPGRQGATDVACRGTGTGRHAGTSGALPSGTPATTTSTARPSATITVPPSTMAGPPGYGRLIFDDSFAGTGLDRSKWNTYIACSGTGYGAAWNGNGSGGSGGSPGGFSAAYYEPSQLRVDDGLRLTAVRGSSQPRYQWTSAVVSTWGHFEFTGGYVQIRARMTDGDGMWPALWMLDNGARHEIDIFEGNFTGNGVDPDANDAWTLHTPSGAQFGGLTNMGTDLGAGYHVYGLKWIPGRSITWYVDGTQIGRVTSAEAPIPDDPMELLINLDVASSRTAGWHSPQNRTSPSPSVMRIAQVQVYQ